MIDFFDFVFSFCVKYTQKYLKMIDEKIFSELSMLIEKLSKTLADVCIVYNTPMELPSQCGIGSYSGEL